MYQKMTFRNSFDTRDMDPVAFSKLTWSGLMVAAFGWMLLLSGGSVQLLLSSNAPSVGLIAQCTIISGFALALLGALHTGFSALTRFFDTVLQRTASRQQDQALAHYEPPAQREVNQSMSRRVAPPRPASTRMEPAAAPVQRVVPSRATTVKAAAAKVPHRKVLERGWWKDRAYTMFHDGSVEIETLLGLRRFACMDDAQDFIG